MSFDLKKIIGVFCIYILGTMGFLNAEVETIPAFWLNGPMAFPKNSTQYFHIPFPGGTDLHKVKDFKIVLTMPDSFSLEKNLRMPVWCCFGFMMFAYPESIQEERVPEGRKKYILGFRGLGTTGVQTLLSIPGDGKYREVATVTGSGDWSKYSGELKIPGNVSPSECSFWILRWTDREGQNIGRNIFECRGTVDVDNLSVRDMETGKIVYEEGFESTDGQGILFRNSSAVKENGNSFIRINTTDESARLQESMNMKIPFMFVPDKTYGISFSVRSHITKTPPGYVVSPVFISLGDTDLKNAEISCSYTYAIDGKSVSTPAESLRVNITDRKTYKYSSDLDVVLWSAAEDSMGVLPDNVQDIILRITKDSGVKMHFTELHVNPWMKPYNGDISKMVLRDPLALKINKLGMKSAPYIACGFYDWDESFFNSIRAYLEEHPEEAAINAFGKKIEEGGKDLRTELPVFCPSRLLSGKSEFWNVFLDFLRRGASENKWNGLMWDYEVCGTVGFPYPKDTRKMGCFCDECVKRFKEKFNIRDLNEAPAKRPQWPEYFPIDQLSETARLIIKNHYLEWMKFRNGQNAEMWGSMIGAVREIDKDARFYLYSASMRQLLNYGMKVAPPFHHCEWDGVYLPEAGKYIDAYMDIHYPQTGIAGLNEIQFVRQSVRSSGRPVKVLNTVYPLMLRNKLAKNQCINSVAYTMSDGIQIYAWGGSFDSQTWALIGEGMRTLGDFEEYFSKGVRMDNLAKLNMQLPYSVWLKGENRVIFIINDSNVEKTLKMNNIFLLKEPGLRYKAENYFTGEVYPDPARITLKIPPYDCGVIKISAF